MRLRMTDDLQERIRQRAIQIWEAAGRPDGEHDQHWREAEAQIESEDAARTPSATQSKESPVEEATALGLAETSDLSPNQAKELLRKHGGDMEKVKEEAKSFKAES